MKKIGILILALLIAMGALGAGYAMWSDSIFVKGTVTTGSVDILLSKTFSQTYVWKTADTADPDRLVVTDSSTPPLGAIDAFPNDGQAPADIDPVSYATASQTMDGSSPVDDAVTFTFVNLFPLELSGDVPGADGVCADFNAVYNGTVPVHVASNWQVVQSSVSPADRYTQAQYVLANFTHYEISVNEGDPVPIVDWNDVQLHQGDRINVRVCIDIPQTYDPDGQGSAPVENTYEDFGNMSFSFLARMLFYQWNEPAPATVDLPSPTP